MRFGEIDNLTGIIYPCYKGHGIFEVLKNSSLPEGDVIRFFRQIIDRLSQIKAATQDRSLGDMMDNCQKIVAACIEEVDV